jgi:spore germination protein YaaH
LPTSPRRPTPVRTPSPLATAVLGMVVLAVSLAAPATGLAVDEPASDVQPSIHYEEARKHAGDDLSFTPGGRVTVGFTPRAGDRTQVGGGAPRALPAGRLTGREIRAAASAPMTDATPEPTADPSSTPIVPSTAPSEATPSAAPSAPAADPSAPADPLASDAPPIDAPTVDPSAVVEADGVAWTDPAVEAPSDLTAEVDPGGLRKEVFGFLPYWELSDSSTVLDYKRLSTIAYFGVGASAAGNLEKTSGGEPTVGWAGWTSSRLTTIINDAHRNSTRVVLTVQSFAWSEAGKTKQKTLLGSSAARANLAKTIAATIRDRGADGVNLDFEPIASGYDDEFVLLVKSVRAELDKVHKGYQLTFDTTGSIGNYPIEAATASGAADAIMIMGYDYRQAGSAIAGSIAPLKRTGIDIIETLDAYTARVPASKLILGVPYYGRAWSTVSDALRAATTDAAPSSSVTYASAVGYLADHGRRYDATEGVAWTAYRRDGAWRQLYVDDAQALKAKYDLINRYGLRGAGIWALGYDGARTELWQAISEKFINDTTAPRAGIKTLSTSQASESFKVSWASADDIGIASHDVDVAIDGGAWARWISATKATSATYVGARGHTFAFRARARDPKGNVSSWTGVPSGATAKVAVGGFGRVVTDTLNARSGAGITKTLLTTLTTGDLVAFLQGPVAADGYQWYRVAAPLTEWSVVGSARSDLWIATGGGGEAYVGAVAPPNTTKVAAGATRVASPGAEWYPVSPIRLLDTRAANGLSGAFVDEQVRTFQLTGRGTVPVDAVAVTANLTVTGSTASGYVSIGPEMTASPKTSTINVGKGQTLANGLTLRVGAGGKVSAVFASSSGAKIHQLVDLTGYFR